MPEELDMTSGSVTKEAIAVALHEQHDDSALLGFIATRHYPNLPATSTPQELYDFLCKKYAEYHCENYYEKIRRNNLNKEHAEECIAESKAEFSKFPTLSDMGRQYLSNIKHYGSPNWYDWCCSHWGTKWNASNTNYDEENECLHFNTAWSAPEPIFVALAAAEPTACLEIESEYEGGFVCIGKIENGEYTVVKEYDSAYEEEEEEK